MSTCTNRHCNYTDDSRWTVCPLCRHKIKIVTDSAPAQKPKTVTVRNTGFPLSTVKSVQNKPNSTSWKHRVKDNNKTPETITL